MALVLTLIHTPTRNRLEFDYSGFDHLIGLDYATLADLVQAVSPALGTRTDVLAYYVLMGKEYRVHIHANRPSSGPSEVPG